ncbi:SgcJ/EcaC family oxidoreductase [Pseudoroseicyclus sp. CXY001]|uniref:YybH family protein n=1 Tax=Pseudoroseicyclus sp. CXY001 TaxID=3242492 RepID=UPI003570E0BE
MTDTSEITALADTYVAAAWDKDVERFLSIYDNQIFSYDTWESWSIAGIRNWEAMVREWFGSLQKERVRVTIEPERVEMSDGLAFVAAAISYAAIAPDDRELRSMTTRMTWVARKTDAGWRVIHEHGSAPIGFADLKADLRGPQS